MHERAVSLPSQEREVVSYEDDVFAWAYLDQRDGLIRYEAYVVGYNERGEPTTLAFVFEEGAFSLDDFPMVRQIWLETRCGSLGREQWETLHRIFEEQERELKRVNRLRWTHRLRALGYDVVGSAR